jgi:hypothetical protein
MIEPITIVPVPTNAPGGVPRPSEAASRIDLILARPCQFKMIGDSMRPRYRPGEMIYVDPALAPKLDEHHVFFNEQRQAIVGRLIAMSPAMWRIAQRAETIRDHRVTRQRVADLPRDHREAQRLIVGPETNNCRALYVGKYQSLFSRTLAPFPSGAIFLAEAPVQSLPFRFPPVRGP